MNNKFVKAVGIAVVAGILAQMAINRVPALRNLVEGSTNA